MSEATAMFVGAFIVAAMISIGIAYLISKGLFTRKGVDGQRDAHRKFNHQNVSRLGGLCLVCGYLSGFVLFTLVAPEAAGDEWLAVIVVTSGFFLLGFIDDIRPIGARLKLAGQFAIAIGAFELGIRIDGFTSLDGETKALLGAATLPISVLWLVAIPNLINLIDGMDGLATGVGIFVCSMLALMAISGGQVLAAVTCLALVGALLGFLLFNFPPAKVYLGDGGAYFLGSFIATHSMMTSQKGSVMAVFLVTLIALGLPIIDTAYAIARRAIRGLPLSHADAHHVHHRLQRRGFSKRRSLFILYGICIVFCLTGLAIFWNQGVMIPIAAAVFFFIAIFGAKHLEFVQQWSGLRAQTIRALKRRRDIKRAHRTAAYLMDEMEHCDSSEEFFRLFSESASRLGFLPDASSASQREDAESEDKLFKVKTLTPGNPGLHLYVPERLRYEHNWVITAECLYAPFVKAHSRFGIPVKNGSANLSTQ